MDEALRELISSLPTSPTQLDMFTVPDTEEI